MRVFCLLILRSIVCGRGLSIDNHHKCFHDFHGWLFFHRPVLEVWSMWLRSVSLCQCRVRLKSVGHILMICLRLCKCRFDCWGSGRKGRLHLILVRWVCCRLCWGVTLCGSYSKQIHRYNPCLWKRQCKEDDGDEDWLFCSSCLNIVEKAKVFSACYKLVYKTSISLLPIRSQEVKW